VFCTCPSTRRIGRASRGVGGDGGLDAAFFGGFALDSQVLVTAVTIGISVGLLSGVFPAVAAARLKIVDGLRRL